MTEINLDFTNAPNFHFRRREAKLACKQEPQQIVSNSSPYKDFEDYHQSRGTLLSQPTKLQLKQTALEVEERLENIRKERELHHQIFENFRKRFMNYKEQIEKEKEAAEAINALN